MRNTRRNSKGLTLVEVLVALAFTGVAFAALALSQVTGFRVTRGAQETSIAKDLAVGRLELIRAYGFDPYVDCPGNDPPTGYPACSGSENPASQPGFTVAWALDNQPTGVTAVTPPALVQVTVSVTWPRTAGGQGSYQLVSYLSCGDPGEGASTTVPCPTSSLGPW